MSVAGLAALLALAGCVHGDGGDGRSSATEATRTGNESSGGTSVGKTTPTPTKKALSSPAYLIFMTYPSESGFEEDTGLYAASADGRRVLKLARIDPNRTSPFPVLAPERRWIAISRVKRELDLAPEPVLISPNGRERALGLAGWEGEVRPGTFSPRGRFFAFGLSTDPNLDDLCDDPLYHELFWCPRHKRHVFYRGDQIAVHDLVKGATREFGPGIPASFSPDGRLLAFQGPFSESVGVVVLQSSVRRILFRKKLGFFASQLLPRWSPTGRKLAFVFEGFSPKACPDQVNCYHLFVVDVNDGKAQRLQLPWGVRREPVELTWLSEEQLAATRTIERNTRRGVGAEVAIVDLDRKEHRTIAQTDTYAWSPKRDRLAYLSSGTLFILELDGTTRQLDLGGPRALDLSWSPDGRWLAVASATGAHFPYYQRPRPEPGELFLVDANNLRRSRTGVGAYGAPVWSPDGHAFAVGGPYGVRIVSLDPLRTTRLIRIRRAAVVGWLKGRFPARPHNLVVSRGRK